MKSPVHASAERQRQIEQWSQLIAERYEAVIFDLDGTLLDSMPLHLAAWEATARQFGFTYDAAALYDWGGIPSRKIVGLINEAQGLALDIDRVAAHKVAHYRAHIDQVQPISETLAVASALAGKLPMAIGTGSPRRNVEHLLGRHALAHLFDVVVTADDVELHKPHPHTFLRAAELMHTAPRHCLVFEDTPIGMQAAKAAAMDALLIQRGFIQWPPVICADSDHSFAITPTAGVGSRSQ